MEDLSFEQRYQENNIPWDRDQADVNLINVVNNVPVQPCRSLDLGCGTGINSIWLSQQGFTVTGIDLSPTAIEMATERAKKQKANVHLFSCDFLEPDAISESFEFIFDRGAFHCFDGVSDKIKCAHRIAALLEPHGLWLSLIGNADDKPREVGPPTLRATEIIEIVEPYFEIISLTSGYFGGEQEDPPKAWICLMKKRGQP